MPPTSLSLSDVRGLARLATDATTGVTDLVEAVHQGISRPLGMPRRGIAGLVYGSVRGVARLAGGGVDALLAPLVPRFSERGSSPGREAWLAALNGVVGDRLAASGNPLAIPMALRRDGMALVVEREALAAAFPQTDGRLLVLAHGLCRSDLQWRRNGHDHGAALERDLGFTAVYLNYNSGLHISTNGRAFAAQLENLIDQWPRPVEELAIVGHSMGGLVARSALHYGVEAGCEWPRRLRKIVFLGTPHRGAALERGGNGVDALLAAAPYAAPFARLGQVRSAGITDLRHGNLLDEDWAGRDRFAPGSGVRRSVLLPEDVLAYAAAASMGSMGKLGLLGDGLVSLASAFGLAIPESRRWVGYGMNHLDLLARPEVYEQIRGWLAA
jgi:pimeloyl-ACP methyl ester carboxylesterase